MRKLFLPVTDFLAKYTASDTLRLHMPGHKGRSLPDFPQLAGAYAWDITEISGADSLFEAESILLQAEQETAALYGSRSCCWSAGGSTLCIQAMLAQMKAEGRTVIAARTVHRAFLNACILLDLPVKWVFPHKGGILSGVYQTADFSAALAEAVRNGEKPCLYVTSPDYTGNLQDIAALSALCREFSAPLLVDNAHGAHLAFLAENRHPMALGADYCCDSVHKMLPGLTGAAILHSRHDNAQQLKQQMQLFGSTSPSYLIMQSIEASTHWLRNGGTQAVRNAEKRAKELRKLFPQFQWLGEEPLHLSISANGVKLAENFRKLGIEPEYADKTCLVLLLSPAMTDREWERLQQVLSAAQPEPAEPSPALPAPMEAVCSMRTAALSAWEQVPLREACGRICAPVQVPCPPAVPIAVSGERLNAEWLELMAFYGLQNMAVLRT